MFRTQLSNETAFELLLHKANKTLQKKLTRVDLHFALSELDLKFTAPEVDSLFKSLDTNNDGELDLDEWSSRIYCDTQNPL
jgi:Ca2+-binding EF-hand superfamily protein